MAKFNFVKGTQNKTLKLFLQDSSKTDGSGLTGLVAPASNLTTPVNSAFSTTTTGGSLVAGTYYYRVTATNALGESLPSTETSQVVPAGTATNTVTVNWGSVANATGYKVYGRLQNGELLIATVGAVNTYVDTGAITPAGAIPTLSAVGLTCYYAREGANASVAVTLANAILGTYQSGGFIAVDNTNMPGLYELGIPNAALAAGATSIVLMLKGASNLAPYLAEIQLDATDNQDATHGGLTSLPNVAAGAAGGLPTATNSSGQVVASSVVGAVTTDVSGLVGTNLNATVSSRAVPGDVTAGLTAQGYTPTLATNIGTTNTTVSTNLNATVGSRATPAQILLTPANLLATDSSNRVTVGSNADKSGYALSATGVDALLTDVTSDADMRSSGFKMLRGVFNRFFNNVTQTATQQKVNNDAGTLISTMTTSDDGTTATKSKSA